MSTVIHFIGLDVHKESVSVSIAPSNSTEVRFYGNIGGRLDDIDRLIKKLAQPGVELRFCYEAGPTGYPLCRHLRKHGYVCAVVAPSLIPKKASDRVKTNRRDSDQLARARSRRREVKNAFCKRPGPPRESGRRYSKPAARGKLQNEKTRPRLFNGLVQPLIASALRPRDSLSVPSSGLPRAGSGQSYLCSLGDICSQSESTSTTVSAICKSHHLRSDVLLVIQENIDRITSVSANNNSHSMLASAIFIKRSTASRRKITRFVFLKVILIIVLNRFIERGMFCWLCSLNKYRSVVAINCWV